MGRVSSINTESIYSRPSVAPPVSGSVESEDHWSSFDNSVNAVSFGFVATAILISMFLVMAIFERFPRPRSTAAGVGGHSPRGVENTRAHEKLDHPSPKTTVYAKEVSVLMPGEEIPTFIEHLAPAPVPCPLEKVSFSQS
ncbi:unnamed protein product [Fraxinus pennsylvanica]|uniref:Uncharacterized protein n=1 Tax=Fraxinus pennsylvanica TaxID=56036 RepID=A0AAD1ZSN5_9LAMI|nr:unnamed protein product [Fraxinus pennsylvanica]